MIRAFLIFFAYTLFFLSSASAYDLRITEVLVDGSDEFIEIANIGDTNFSGSISLSGVKSSLLTLPNISLPAGELLVLGDTLSYLSSDFTGVKKSGLGLSVIDTAPVHISLIVSEEIIDEFVVSSGDVLGVDNTMTSFHRLRDGSEFSIFPTDLSYIRGSTITANPGRLYRDDGSLYLPVGLGTGPINEEPESPLTGSESCPDRSSVVIDEIYNGTGYSHYIELLVLDDRDGSFSLSGTALGAPITLPSQLWEKNTRYLVTSSLSGLLHTENIMVIPTLSFGTGSITLTRQDSHVMDKVIILSTEASRYNAGTLDCDRFFTRTLSPSPGFDDKFLGYLNSVPPTNFCPITEEPIDPPIVGTGSTGGIVGVSGDLRISLIDYDPPGSDTNNERIGLLSLSGDLSLSGRNIKYDGKTYNFSSGLVFSGQEVIRTANFQFVNSRPVCVSLFFVNTLIDTACYNPSVHPSPYLPLAVTSTGIQMTDLQLSIVTLVYDPLGSDTDNETITLRFDGGAASLLLDDLRLRIGTKTKRIYGTMFSGQTLTIVGNFQMPNSTDTCVALTYGDIVYDEYCYTIPSKLPPPNTEQPTEYLNSDIRIEHILYDPDGSDTDNETITLHLSTPGSVDLSHYKLRFGTTIRSLQGILRSGISTSIRGNYQFPNSKSTCVELLYGEKIIDTYCYDPDVDKNLTGQQISGDVLSGVVFKINNLIYDPDGSDTNREVITITVSESLSLHKPLTISFNKTKKKLSDALSMSGTMSFVGNYQMPNSKATCVQLLYDKQILDEYCYDPNQKETVLSGAIDMSARSGLRLSRVLPNPKGKDITNSNELIAFSRSGQTGQVMDKDLKLKIGSSTLPLSGVILGAGETVRASSKTLPNTPNCLLLYAGDTLLDRLCYPQAKEGTRYYHDGNNLIPASLMDTLNFEQGNLSKLLLKKIEKKICLTYEGVQIRCMAAGESSTSKKNRALLTLNNSYVAQISSLYYTNTLHPQTLRQRFQSYNILAKKIKNEELGILSVYGTQLKPTELKRYVDTVYNQDPEEYMLDQLGSSLFGHDKMDEYYKKIYQ